MTATINIKTDAELKQSAERLFAELGMNMTTALNIFLRQAVRENAIPFKIGKEPFFSPANIDAIKKSEAQIRRGLSVAKTLRELEAMANA